MQILRLLVRGLLKRCPRCGAGGLFTGWFTMRDACPRCGLVFEREEGYWVGAMTIAIVLTELLFAVMATAVIVVTWPDLPVVPMIVLGVALNGLFPVFFYPFTKTLWLATDLAFFHPEAARLDGPAQPSKGASGRSGSAPHSDQEPS